MNERLNTNKTLYKISDLIPDLKNHKGEKADISFAPKRFPDLPYADTSPAQKLDLYLPAAGREPYPVILYLHGGAFLAGDKTDWVLTPVLQALSSGYAVASANYRYCSESLFPGPVHDVKAALRFLRAQASSYSLDPKKIALWGESAGAYLALMAALTTGVPGLEDLTMGNPEYASTANAVINWYAPSDTLGTHLPKAENRAGNDESLFSVLGSPLNALLGQPPEKVPAELAAMTNPVHYVSSSQAPPVYTQHGSEDCIVPLWQSEILTKLLAEKIGPENVALKVLAGAKHGGPEFHTAQNIHLILDFLDRVLR